MTSSISFARKLYSYRLEQNSVNGSVQYFLVPGFVICRYGKQTYYFEIFKYKHFILTLYFKYILYITYTLLALSLVEIGTNRKY